MTSGCPFDCGPVQVAPAEGLPAGRADHVGVQPGLPDLLHGQQERRRAHALDARASQRSSSTSSRTTTSSTSSTSRAASRRCTRSCRSSCDMARDGRHPPPHRLDQRAQAARTRTTCSKLAAPGRAHRPLARHLRRGRRQEDCWARTRCKSKLKVLDLLEKHDVTTTILPAVAAGLNDKDVGPLLELVPLKRLSSDRFIHRDVMTLGQPLPIVAQQARMKPAITRPHLGPIQHGRKHLQRFTVLDDGNDAVDGELQASHVRKRCFLAGDTVA